MTEDAVTRAVQSAAREAFRLGKAAATDRGQAVKFQEQAQTYALDLVLPIVEVAVQQALEEQWTREREATVAQAPS